MSLDSDLIAAFADTWATKEITFGDQVTRGYFEQADRPLQTANGIIVELVTTMSIRTGSLVGVKKDSEVVIEGVMYFVEYVGKIEDGSMTELTIVEPEE